MKNKLWQSLFSAFVAGIFLWLAVGSAIEREIKIEDLGDGRIRKTIDYSPRKQEYVEIQRDEYGVILGEIKITYVIAYVEIADFVDGKRHGKAEYHYPDGIYYKCYEMGVAIDCEKSALIQSANESAYNILENEYPWFLFFLNAFDFDAEHIQSFFNRIETNLAGYEFDFEEFDDYYDSALEEIEESGEEFSEIMEVNSIKVMVEGYECLKRVELRKAVIDRHRSEGEKTFDIVKSGYPGYLSSVLTNQEATATENDFELFCNELDSRMDAFGPLDTEDPFFTDSIDSRMYTAFYSILMENKSLNALVLETKSASNIKDAFSINQLQRNASFLLKRIIPEGNLQNAAIIVVKLMQQEYYKGDIVRQCVKKAYTGTANGGSGIAGNWEYWFNNDYNTRVKSSMSVLPGMAFGNNISTNSLEAGMHTLFIRFRDEKGLWSVPQSFIFFKGGQLLSNFEYWFNNDYDNKINVETVRSDSLRLNTTIQTNHLGNGMHWVHFWFKDASGIYGPVQSHLFWKTGQRLVAFEYWFDNGTNNRVSGQLAGNNEEEWIKIIEIASGGFEKVHARFKDSGGLWSPVVSMDVPVTVSVAAYKQLQNISIYPNPASLKLNISFASERDGDMVFTLYDSQGKIVLTRSFDTRANIEQTFMVEVGDLLNGLYLCVLETNDERSVFKAIINR